MVRPSAGWRHRSGGATPPVWQGREDSSHDGEEFSHEGKERLRVTYAAARFGDTKIPHPVPRMAAFRAMVTFF
jgi:hypothetical protein